MIKSLLVAFLVAAVAPASAGNAPAYVPADFLASAPKLPPGYHDADALLLDLDSVLKMSLEHNLGLSIERRQMRASELAELAAHATTFDPTVSLGFNHAGASAPPSSAQAGMPGSVIRSAADTWDLSASQGLPTGGRVSLGWSSSRLSSSSGTAVEPLTYSSTLTLSVTQPLFRGFSPDLVIPHDSILTAEIASEQERNQLAISAAQLIQQTESAYWDVVMAMYSYDVTAKSQQAAEDTVTLARRQVAAGMSSPAELPGAENTLARRKIELLDAAASVEQAWDALRTVINLPHGEWKRPLLPTEHPSYEPEAVPTADAAFATAIAHRPEMTTLKLDAESADLALRKAENDALPQIDLTLGTSVFGQNSTYGGALAQLGDHTDTGWSAGVYVTWTPFRRADKANLEIARIQHDVRAAARDQKILGLWGEIRNAVRAERAAELEVVAASQSRTLAAQALEIENRKYQSGASSNLNIATLQNGLAEAELTELRSVISHRKAATALLLATGQLLDHRHVSLYQRGYQRGVR